MAILPQADIESPHGSQALGSAFFKICVIVSPFAQSILDLSNTNAACLGWSPGKRRGVTLWLRWWTPCRTDQDLPCFVPKPKEISSPHFNPMYVINLENYFSFVAVKRKRAV
jgi:hypothetical protein